VQQVLNEIQCGDKPILNVFNKIDLVIEPSVFERIKERYPDALFISAKLNKGIESLKQEIIRTFQSLELNNTVL
ncbi:MAG: hypothetical protein WBI42_00485, partial [Candidatus Hydrothermia bacterium]